MGLYNATKPLAIIPFKGDLDILPWTLYHLFKQNCEVYLINNHTPDGETDSVDSISAPHVIGYEWWPEVDTGTFDWGDLLRRIEEIALRFPDRWIIQHDADEIRRPPKPYYGETLHSCLYKAKEYGGCNAVDFECTTFVPIDNRFKAGDDPERTIRHIRKDHVDHHIPHVKAWWQEVGLKVDLAGNGGHNVEFPGKRVFPEKFQLKHYPLRNEEQGFKKLQERIPRFNKKEVQMGWHAQYADIIKQPTVLVDPATVEYAQEKAPITVVTLSRYPDIFNRFADSVDKYEPDVEKICITSGTEVFAPRYGWKFIPGIEPFVFARNANLGIVAANPDSDILLCNDDMELVQPISMNLLDTMRGKRNGKVGIVAPQIIGGGTCLSKQCSNVPLCSLEELVELPDFIPFMCVLLSNRMLFEVGLLDEDFTQYGGEDLEYCHRAADAGWQMYLRDVKAIHGFGDHACTSTFNRAFDGNTVHLKAMRGHNLALNKIKERKKARVN